MNDDKTPFNQLPEDEQVQRMGDAYSFPRHSSVAQLVTTKSDADLALEYRDKIIEAYQPLLKILTELDKAGFNASVNVSKNGLGKIDIVGMQISRVFTIF